MRVKFFQPFVELHRVQVGRGRDGTVQPDLQNVGAELVGQVLPFVRPMRRARHTVRSLMDLLSERRRLTRVFKQFWRNRTSIVGSRKPRPLFTTNMRPCFASWQAQPVWGTSVGLSPNAISFARAEQPGVLRHGAA